MIKYDKDSGRMEITTIDVIDVDEVVDEVIHTVNRWIEKSEICISYEDYPDFLNIVLEKAKIKKGE